MSRLVEPSGSDRLVKPISGLRSWYINNPWIIGVGAAALVLFFYFIFMSLVTAQR